jgi:hypothetical protein
MESVSFEVLMGVSVPCLVLPTQTHLLPGLLFSPEVEGGMFLGKDGLSQTVWNCNPEDFMRHGLNFHLIGNLLILVVIKGVKKFPVMKL